MKKRGCSVTAGIIIKFDFVSKVRSKCHDFGPRENQAGEINNMETS